MLPSNTTSTTTNNPRPRSVADIVRGVRQRAGERGAALGRRIGETRLGKAAAGAQQRLAAHTRARPDSLAALATNNYGKGAAALSLGMIDETDVAQRFEKATMMKPSTAVFALGLVSRVLNLDASLPRVRAANTATLLGAGPVKIYDLGRRITQGLRAAGSVPPAAPSAPPVPAASGYSPGESEINRGEDIPSEATIS
jgi:hypothetical protein